MVLSFLVMVFCRAAWSALGSVVSEKVVDPPPENAARSELPPDPMVTSTVFTPLMSSSACSTLVEAVCCASKLLPSGRVWLTVSVF